MSANRGPQAETFRVWAPDFDEWPASWMGIEEDLAYGRKLMPWFAGFLQALYKEGRSRKTFNQYRDNLWLLGGTIIRQVSWDEAYQDDPRERLTVAVGDDGILPDHCNQMSQVELRAFERMCRKFEKYLGEAK